MLKGRWSCLRGLRIGVEDMDDEGRVTCWIRACVVLHNLLIDTAELYMDNEDPEDDDYDPEPEPFDATKDDPLKHPARLRIMTLMGFTPSIRVSRPTQRR